MRIATASYMDLLHQNIRDAEGKLSILTRQITSGRQIHAPSDDPIAASQALRAHGVLEANLGQQRVLERALQHNRALDDALGELSTPLRTAYNAAMKATQPGLGETGRLACAQEIESALSRLVSLGNFEFAGTYLLGGTDNRHAPLVQTADPDQPVQYTGNDIPMRISVAPGRSADITITGERLFNFADAGGNRAVSEVDADVFQVMSDLARDVRIGYENGIAQNMEKLDTLLRHAISMQGVVGAVGLRLEQSLDVARNLEVQTRTILAEVEDVDIVRALLEVEKSKLAYQAALTATAQMAQMPTLFDRM